MPSKSPWSSLRRAVVLGAARAYTAVAITERGGFHMMRAARKCLPRSQWNGTFHVRGMDLTLDLGTYPDCCMACGIYELDTLRAIHGTLRPGGWFVDGGANIGYFTILASRIVGPSGRVDAYEPDPLNRRRLEENVRRNDASNVRIHPVGLWDSTETVSMTHPSGDGSNHGMTGGYLPGDIAGERFSAQVVRLDEHLEGIPTLIKLDVEGAELRALQGISGLLSGASPPALIVEHNATTATAAGYEPADLFRLITQLQPAYRAYWIGMRLWPIPTLEDLLKIHRQGNLLFRAE